MNEAHIGTKQLKPTVPPTVTEGTPTILRVIESGATWSAWNVETGASSAEHPSSVLVAGEENGDIRIIFMGPTMRTVLRFAHPAMKSLLASLLEHNTKTKVQDEDSGR